MFLNFFTDPLLSFKKASVFRFVGMFFFSAVVFLWVFSGFPQFFGFPPGPFSLQAQQVGRPDADDDVAGSWDGDYTDINDPAPDDNTFIETSSHNPSNGDYFQVSISDLDDPNIDTGHIVRYRYGKSASGGRDFDITVGLYQGSTLIASWSHGPIPSTPITQTQTLTTGQASQITDYSDLKIRYTIDDVGGGQPRTPRWYWAEFEVPDVVAAGLPSVDTFIPDPIGQTQVTGQGEVTDTGGGNVTQRGFVWSTSSQSDPGNQSPASSSYEDNVGQGGSFGPGIYSLDMTGLTPGETYYYRAYAENSEGFSYGDEISFTTDPVEPTVITNSASSIGTDSALGHGEITDTGGDEATERGFVWSTSSQSNPGNTAPGSSAYSNFVDESGSFEEGSFSLTLSGLSLDTTYFYRAYARNSEGYSYGNEIEFSTLGDFPAVSTLTPQNIEQTSVTGRGDITDVGADDVTQRGFVWSTESLSNPGNTAPGNSAYSDFVDESGSFGTGIFALPITGLNSNTNYFYRVYARNSEGYSYGSELSFQTEDEFPELSTASPFDVQTRSVEGSGSITDDGGLEVTQRGFVWSTSSQSNPGNTAPGNSGYSDFVDESGSFGEGSFSLTLSGLDPETTYYYRAYAENSEGYGYGNEVSFTTASAQFSRPDGDSGTGSWQPTPLYQQINSVTRNDSSFIFSDDNTSPDIASMDMSEVSDPGVNSGHIFRYTYRKDDTGGHTVDFRIRLLEGTTEIAEWFHPNISSTFVLEEQTLSGSQAGSITDYSNLVIEVSREGGTGGGPGTHRSVQVSWVELELPEPAPISPPSVSTQQAQDIAVTDAEGQGTVTSTGNLTINERGFVFSTQSQPDPGDTAPASSGYDSFVNETGSFGGGGFNLTMGSLDPGTVYFYRAYARNSEGYSYGGEVAFQTFAEEPTVSTSQPTNLSATEADGQGEIVFEGLNEPTERGFVWSTESQPNPGNTAPGNSTYSDFVDESGSFSAGSFSLTISGLSGDTVYYYRAYARNDEGYGYGQEIEFQTPGVFVALTTNDADNITQTEADGHGVIDNIGESNPTERGFVWSTVSNPNPGDTPPGESAYGSLVDETGSFGPGSFSLTLSGLEEGRVYFYRTFALNTAGYSYGNEVSFATLSPRPTLLTEEPSSLDFESAMGVGDIISTGDSDVTQRGFVWSTESLSNPGNTAPGSSGYESNISQNGNFSEGSYSISLSPLNEDTIYYYRAFAQNSQGYGYGQEIEFTTPQQPLPPEITDLVLNEGGDIFLMEGATTTVPFSAVISDPNGFNDLNQSTLEVVVFRSGVGEGCEADDNNCYFPTDLSLENCEGTSCDLVGSVDMQFFTEPTDIGDFESEEWLVWVYIEDSIGLNDESISDDPVDVLTLAALSVGSDIDYGELEPGTNTGDENQITVVRNTGNTDFTTYVSGTDLTSNGQSISVSLQKWLTSPFTYSDSGNPLSETDQSTSLELLKPTSLTPVEGNLFWGLSIPSIISSGFYEGVNFFSAIP